MRIIRGKLKSQRFSAPKGFPSRPTTDFAKEGLFNMLENQYSLINLDILDLCAGTGNITLEFASREAGHITAIDQNFKCTKFIFDLVKKHNLHDDVKVYKSDAVKFLEKTKESYDIIFTDPPFAADIHDDIHRLVFERELLNPGGVLIIEHGRECNFEAYKHFQFVRKYGGVNFAFFQIED
ncbi:16S rRNA (guanine(966)-N(2))-methyltransferase RsmD [Lishizhenia tianjinensis]|uniref:16S rRNA (Guanine(966)-N(2))-methyltransferase RsmD n=1 Tax=Lishizhenia tianjinensis TaxID=477690 RepID=A0A1I6YWW4_9FLAO|nr:RsmD family RNA methyltransferase [Lishizhenia tianjinensis]SFT54917.1 16S rRNA (guanine(966)-N(2))-methyltransferase RsmD [Lishizhenia tianjinensis]